MLQETFFNGLISLLSKLMILSSMIHYFQGDKGSTSFLLIIIALIFSMVADILLGMQLNSYKQRKATKDRKKLTRSA